MKRNIIIVGAAGSGKTSIEKRIVDLNNLQMIVGNTTRKKRSEENNSSYNFLSDEEFEKEEYLERVEYDGNKYGISAKYFNEHKHVYVLTQEGVDRIKKILPKDSYIEVFIACPKEVCKERMLKRGNCQEMCDKRILSDEERGAFDVPKNYDNKKSIVINGELPIEENIKIIMRLAND